MIKQDALPGFESRGSIVNVTSLCGTAPMLGAAAYSATQGAGIALTKTDALDYGPDKIRVNSVAPGYIAATDVASPMGNEHNDWFAERTAWKRNGKPQDVANVVCWLSSPQAVFITGLNVPVDGGLNLYNRD